MKYGVLGPLELRDNDGAIPLNQPKQRALLASLLIGANQVVSKDRLLENLWGTNQPSSGLKALQYHVSLLRDALNPGRQSAAATVLQTRPTGYLLEVAEGELDSHRFGFFVEQATELLSTDAKAAKGLLDQATSLWRGPAFADFQFDEFAKSEAIRLEENRLLAIELTFEAELLLNQHQQAIPRLTSAVIDNPYRERLRGLLITALYRSGRQAEALSTYQEMRKLLGEELGISPSPELVALEHQVLEQGSSLQAPTDTGPSVRLVGTTPTAAGTNLPAQLTSFVGRVDELDAVVSLTRTHRLVTITGPGGMGKTRLALEAAHHLGDREKISVWFVDLATLREPGLVDQAVFDAVGATERPNSSLRDSLTSHFGNRDILLILDNCEHLVEAAASIAAHLATRTQRVSVLATSQHVLRLPGELVYQMPPLASTESDEVATILATDAARLFLDRAVGARPGFVPSESDAVQINQITTQLGGLPLAIELAAARMRMMSVSDITDHLTSRFKLLTDGSQSISRQGTLNATLEWSYELTQAREQAFFDELSVFAGSFSHQAATEVGSVDDPIEVFEVLGRLVDKSLVTVDASGDEMRYRLLESMKLFAARKLDTRGKSDATADRHDSYYLGVVRDGNELLTGPDQATWQRRYRSSIPDIRTTLERLITHRPDDALIAVNGLARFWYRESTNTEAIEWIQRALDAADQAPGANRAHALRWLAGMMGPAGLVQEGSLMSEQALAMAREVGDPVAMAASLTAIGSGQVASGQLREAILSFEEAVDVESSAGIQSSVALLWNLGVAYLELSDVDGLERTSMRLRGDHEVGISEEASAAADLLMCDVATIRGNFAQARDLAIKSRSYYTHIDSPIEVAETLDRLAHLCVAEGDIDGASEHLDRAAELRGDIDDQYKWAANLVQAQAALALANLQEARKALRLVLPVANDRRQVSVLSKLFHEASRVAMAAGDPTAARSLAQAVQEIARQEKVTIHTTIVEQNAAMVESLPADSSGVLPRRTGEPDAREHIDALLDLVRRVLR